MKCTMQYPYKADAYHEDDAPDGNEEDDGSE